MSKGFKKALSLLLVFALVITSVYVGEVKKANAVSGDSYKATLNAGAAEGEWTVTDSTFASSAFASTFADDWSTATRFLLTDRTALGNIAKMLKPTLKLTSDTVSDWVAIQFQTNWNTIGTEPNGDVIDLTEYKDQFTALASSSWQGLAIDVPANQSITIEIYDDVSEDGTVVAEAEDVELAVGDEVTVPVTYSVVSGGALEVTTEVTPSFESNDTNVATVANADDNNATVTGVGAGEAVVTIKNAGVAVGTFNVTVTKAEGSDDPDPDNPDDPTPGEKKTPWAALDIIAANYYPRALTEDGDGKLNDPITGSTTTGIYGFDGLEGGETEIPADSIRSVALDKTDKDADGSGTYTVGVSKCNESGASDIFRLVVLIGNVSEMTDADNDDYNVVITDPKLFVDDKEIKTAATLEDLIKIDSAGNIRISYREPWGEGGKAEERLYDENGEALELPISSGGSVKVQFTIDFHYGGTPDDGGVQTPGVNQPNTNVATTSVTAPKNVTLAQGEKATIAVAAAPANNTDTMSVKSSDTKVVTAALSGKNVTLKGVKAGKSANVTVTSGAKSATIKVKVTKAPKKVKVNKKSVTIKKGKKATVKVTLYSAKKMKKKNKTSVYQLTAKVAKKKVATATVKGTKVTIKGKKKGSTKVTISTFNKKKAVVKVKVK